ncbi:metal-sensitive transcriptional regulator [Leptolyngbya sp. FACHB-17]|uniref:metal-sensitive transcriptional regulator n=1 Tax=unclassified Leptolyngbya TaxID=2650499 RepID=UPI001680AF91|nr:metal-sensitive transcriptional regulator [Leptolyngbya sp. FACHB-17]MBD2082144.1 metal-sensitive transcriptional regulator [Leptolyngbya sp. FACHB-17]
MTHAHTQQVLNRLARIKGHVEAISKMVESDRPCSDVVTQVIAVRSALNKVAQIILLDHVEHCLIEASETGEFEGELNNFRKALDLLI